MLRPTPPRLFPKLVLAIGPSLILIALRLIFEVLGVSWKGPLNTGLQVLGGLNALLGWAAAAPLVLALLERAEIKGTARIALAAGMLLLAMPVYFIMGFMVVGLAG
jgi:hypothetical protein